MWRLAKLVVGGDFDVDAVHRLRLLRGLGFRVSTTTSSSQPRDPRLLDTGVLHDLVARHCMDLAHGRASEVVVTELRPLVEGEWVDERCEERTTGQPDLIQHLVHAAATELCQANSQNHSCCSFLQR